MTQDLFSFAVGDLDFRPRRPTVGQALEVVKSVTIPRYSFLHNYENQVIVRSPDVIGLLDIASSTFTPLDLNFKDIAPSALGDLTLTDITGRVYAWRPPVLPRQIWNATLPGAYFAVSLGGTNLLISRFVEGGHMQEAYAIDVSSGHIIWRLDPGYHLEAVTPYGVLIWSNSMETLQCLDIQTSQPLWSSTLWAGGADLYGIVDGLLWGPGPSSIQRLDCKTGSALPPITVQNAVRPNGIIDDRGIFHCCHGLNYQTFDLRNGGRQLQYSEFRITRDGPSIGAGPPGMIIIADGRLIFSDQRRGVWVVHPDQPTEPKLIFRASDIITRLAAQLDRVILGQHNGIVTLLGNRYHNHN